MNKIYRECLQIFDNVELLGNKIYIRIDYFPVYRRFIVEKKSKQKYIIRIQTCIPPLWVSYGFNKAYPMKVGMCDSYRKVIPFIRARLREMKKM